MKIGTSRNGSQQIGLVQIFPGANYAKQMSSKQVQTKKYNEDHSHISHLK